MNDYAHELPHTVLSGDCPSCDGRGGFSGYVSRFGAFGGGEYVEEDCDDCGGSGMRPLPESVVFEAGDDATSDALRVLFHNTWRDGNYDRAQAINAVWSSLDALRRAERVTSTPTVADYFGDDDIPF